jgi:hypothetical protein
MNIHIYVSSTPISPPNDDWVRFNFPETRPLPSANWMGEVLSSAIDILLETKSVDTSH